MPQSLVCFNCFPFDEFDSSTSRSFPGQPMPKPSRSNCPVAAEVGGDIGTEGREARRAPVQGWFWSVAKAGFHAGSSYINEGGYLIITGCYVLFLSSCIFPKRAISVVCSFWARVPLLRQTFGFVSQDCVGAGAGCCSGDTPVPVSLV